MARTVAFFIYTRIDDRACDGLLTRIRARLEEIVQATYGRDVEVFQDSDDIRGGERWR